MNGLKEHMWRIAQGVEDPQRYAKSVLAEMGIDYDKEQSKLATKRPTIAELEQILNDKTPHEVYMLPNGEVRARRIAEPEPDQSAALALIWIVGAAIAIAACVVLPIWLSS